MRIPIISNYNKNLSYVRCPLLYGNNTCRFRDNHQIITINNLGLIEDCRDSNTPIRLVIPKRVPTEIIHSLTYNSHNILQIDYNLLSNKSDAWVNKLLTLANKSGIYSVVLFNPIIPTITKAHSILEKMELWKSLGKIHYVLKFCELSGGYEVFEDIVVTKYGNIPTKYVEKQGNKLLCNKKAKYKFLSVINNYLIPKNINISICGIAADCSGLGGKYVSKD